MLQSYTNTVKFLQKMQLHTLTKTVQINYLNWFTDILRQQN